MTTPGPRRVLIESPYAGDVARNERYARACLADSLARGEAPFASHLLYTQPGVLDDTNPHEHAAGMAFPTTYRWQGTKRERTRLAGNAVTPPASRDLLAVIAESLEAA